MKLLTNVNVHTDDPAQMHIPEHQGQGFEHCLYCNFYIMNKERKQIFGGRGKGSR